MDILGSIGKLYTFLLLMLLFLGSGLAVWAGINFIIKNKDKITESTSKMKSNISAGLQNVIQKTNGGIKMNNNGFIKLAVFSFIGIIISAAILSMLPKNGAGYMGNMNYSDPQYGSMNMQGNVYGQNTMNMQGMYGQSGMNMQNGNLAGLQQQLYNIQQQLNQLQYQMNYNSTNGMQNYSGYGMNNSYMNNNMNSMNSNMNNGMGNMNNNNMNNSNMNNSNMNNNNTNSSSMPMM